MTLLFLIMNGIWLYFTYNYETDKFIIPSSLAMCLIIYPSILLSFAINMTRLWCIMRTNMFFFTKGYKAINPGKMLIFYLLTFSYLLFEVVALFFVSATQTMQRSVGLGDLDNIYS